MSVVGAAPSTGTRPSERDRPEPWWVDAAVYQVYVRSFRDSNGDGVGDLGGLRDGLADIASLGCDAIWLNPCYASPQRDHGYDIADYMAIDPAYGSLSDFDALVSEAHRLGIRVLMDMVANHSSSEHVWFQEALASPPGSPQRARYIFRDGRGDGGGLQPNNWQSVFGGPAWTRITEADGEPGQWYYHSFDPGQPDFNWRNPEVVEYFDDVLRFWFDRGVDGFRIDVAHGMFKSEQMEDWPGAEDGTGGHVYPAWDQPEVHEIYRRWRAIGDSYAEPKYFVGEIWVPSTRSLEAYVRPDELHQAFNFALLVQPWDATSFRTAIDEGMEVRNPSGAPAWVLSNHDVHRTATRYGQEQATEKPEPSNMIAAARRRGEVDVSLGMRRARAAAALLLALPGTAYLYQGEELGLLEVFDLPDDARQDPIWIRSGGFELGRDGCRVPLPWDDTSPHLGFSPDESDEPWLPVPPWFADFARTKQDRDPSSTLATYRELLGARRSLFGGAQELAWLNSHDPDLLAFARGDGVCVVNFGDTSAELPAGWGLGEPRLTTDTVAHGVLPRDSAAWFDRPTPRSREVKVHPGVEHASGNPIEEQR